MTIVNRAERGIWVRLRCYACGHRLTFEATSCPQCRESFHGLEVKTIPDVCTCDRCVDARRGTKP